MATDYFLKLDGIDGESTDEKFKNHIELESWSFGVAQTGLEFGSRSGLGGAAAAGKANFQDLTISKLTEKSSPKLFEHSATGKHIPKGVLTCRRPGGKQEVFLTVKLEDVIVTNYQHGGAGTGVPTEQVSLNFGTIEVEYFAQDQKGQVKSAGKIKYDLKANKATA
jgi:type VI secretion system secreted protein Hcp